MIELKTWPEFFHRVWNREKTFEIRKNDRDFKAGMKLMLREWNPHKESYSGRYIYGEIGYMTSFNQKKGYVVFQLRNMENYHD